MTDAPDVEVLADSVSGQCSQGSGRLIAPSLVMTARHVISSGEAHHSNLRVRFLHDSRDRPCEVAWDSSVFDIALLRILGSADHAAVEPARWGVFVGSSSNNTGETTGFPWVQESGQGWRDTEQLSLTVNLGTARVSGLLQANIDGPIPDRRPQGLAWAGMSGAALILPHPAGDIVTGVLIEQTPGYGARRLTVVPLSEVLGDATFRAAIRVATGAEPFAEPAELVPLLIPPARRHAMSPASLLRADAEVVGFLGCEPQLARLRDWCSGTGLSIFMLTGPGGQGKTRLARQLAAELSQSGWAIGYLGEQSRGLRADQEIFARLRGCGRPLLLVVDYAETRTDQIADLTSTVGRPRAAIRILLIARSAGDWWETLRASSHELSEVLARAEINDLADLEDAAGQRSAIFGQAIHHLAAGLDGLPDGWPHQPPDLIQTPDLSGHRHASPLAIQMTALAALLGDVADPAASPRRGSRSAEDVILEHESRYWSKTANAQRVGVSRHAQRLAVAAATLCGATDEDEALSLLARLQVLAGQHADSIASIASWLQTLYPAVTGRFWSSLQPDRLGEYFVASIVRAKPVLLTTLLREASQAQSLHALTALAHAASHQRDMRSCLADIIAKLPDLAPSAVVVATRSQQPEILLQPLTQLLLLGPDLSFNLYHQVLDAIPQHTTELLRFAVTVTDHYVQNCRAIAYAEPETGLPLLITGLIGLGKRRMDAGQLELGLASTLEAVEICEQLTSNQENIDPELADSLVLALSNLGAAFLESSLYEEALTALTRADALIRDQAGSGRSSVSQWRRAMVLANLSGTLSKLDRRAEAFSPLEEAIAIFRELDTVDHLRWAPELAMALSSYADFLAATGNKQTGHVRATEAVEALRQVAATHPDAHLPSLASALTTLASCQAAVNLPRPARASLHEAMSILVSLSASSDLVSLPRIAIRMHDVADAYNRLGEHEAALDAVDEAVAISRRHQSLVPHVNHARVARALHWRAGCLENLNRYDDALAAINEACRLQEPLAANNDRAQLLPLIMMRLTRTVLLERLDRPAEAFEEANELTRRIRVLALENPACWRKELSIAVYETARYLVKLGRIEEAIIAARELADWYAGLAGPDSAYLPDQLIALGQLLEVLTSRDLGDARDQALLEKTVSAYRSLRQAGVEDKSDSQGFAEALNRLALICGTTERIQEALELTEEAITVARENARSDPDRHQPHLARLLHNLSNRQVAANRLADSVATADEAIALRRELVSKDPTSHLPGLINTLTSQASKLAVLGETDRALSIAAEAASLLCDATDTLTGETPPGLARLLDKLTHNLITADRCRDSAIAAAASSRLWRRLALANPLRYREGWYRAISVLHAILIQLLVTSVQDALTVLRANQVPLDDGTTSLDELGRGFLITAAMLIASGQAEPARAACEEAVAIQRHVAALNDIRWSPGLALTLNEYSVLLARTGRHDEALAATEEAAAIYRALAASTPGSNRAEVAMVDYNLGLRYAEAGRQAEAIEAAQRAVDGYRALAIETPDAHEADLAMALSDLSRRLQETGSHTKAIAAAKEALLIRSRQAQPGTAPARAELATTTLTYASILTAAGRQADALTALRQAAALFRELDDEVYGEWSAELARTELNLAIKATQLGHLDEGIAAARAAISRYRMIGADHSAQRAEQAMALHNLAVALAASGSLDESLTVMEEALAMLKQLVLTDPVTYEPPLIQGLAVHSRILIDLGQPATALGPLFEAMEIAYESNQDLLPEISDLFLHAYRSDPEAVGRAYHNKTGQEFPR